MATTAPNEPIKKQTAKIFIRSFLSLDHVTPSAYKPLCSPCARSSPTHAMNSGFTALPSG
jgi:hypothetical protein